MKLQYFQTFILLLLCTVAFGNPINNTDTEEKDIQSKLNKRYDINTYIKSVGHYLLSNDIKHVKYNKKNNNNLDIYYSEKDKKNKNIPVVIYIFGGAWKLGDKSFYSKLGDCLRNFGFITVIPNYIQTPLGNLDTMVYDVAESIKWVYKNIDKYGGDRNNITVLGHSSGAHLVTMALLRNTLFLESQSKYFIYDLPLLKRVVLLNCPYDFDRLSEEAIQTGNRIENTKEREDLEKKLKSKDASPYDILRRYRDKSIGNLGAQLIVLMHAEEDATVPVASAYDFLSEIQRTSYSPATLFITQGYYHSGLTEGVMNGDIVAIEYMLRAIASDNLDKPYIIINPSDEAEARKQAEEREKNQFRKEDVLVESQSKAQADKEAQQRFEDYYEWNGEMWVFKDKKTNDYFNPPIYN